MTTHEEITVLGAGIAGLAAALALRLAGHGVRVLEQAPAITEVGAGLQIAPNGGRVLRALGLDEALEEAGTRAQAVQLMDGPKGKPVVRLPLEGKDYHFLHRADLIEMLHREARAQGVTIELGREATAVATEGPRARITFTDGTHEEAGVLIAADGVHSVARNSLGETEPPVYTGQAAWRAIVRPTETPDALVRVHMGAGRHLVHYPLAQGRLINIVAVEERSNWIADGWATPDDPARLRAAFADFALPVRDLLSAVEDVHLWGLHVYPVLRRWHRGALCLIGDAAHPTLPFLAQGANMALEDAMVLSHCLSDAPDTSAAFTAFEAARKERTTRIVAAARANARNYHLRGLPKFIGHTALRLAPGLVTGRFDWIYDYDATTAV